MLQTTEPFSDPLAQGAEITSVYDIHSGELLVEQEAQQIRDDLGKVLEVLGSSNTINWPKELKMPKSQIPVNAGEEIYESFVIFDNDSEKSTEELFSEGFDPEISKDLLAVSKNGELFFTTYQKENGDRSLSLDWEQSKPGDINIAHLPSVREFLRKPIEYNHQTSMIFQMFITEQNKVHNDYW